MTGILRKYAVYSVFDHLFVHSFTPYIRLVKFQLVRQIPDVYVSACVLAGKLFLLFFSCYIIL